MDNIKDENLKKLGKYIAESLFDLSRDTDREDWLEENMRDYTIGELARCVTLKSIPRSWRIWKMCFNENKNYGIKW